MKTNVMLQLTRSDALYIPTFTQDIFSVQSAAANGAIDTCSNDKSRMIAPDDTKIDIEQSGNLYYLNSVNSQRMCNINEWHKILGHCNFKGPSTLATLFSHRWPRFCGGDIYSRRKPLFSSFGEHTVVCGSSMRQAVELEYLFPSLTG